MSLRVRNFLGRCLSSRHSRQETPTWLVKRTGLDCHPLSALFSFHGALLAADGMSAFSSNYALSAQCPLQFKLDIWLPNRLSLDQTRFSNRRYVAQIGAAAATQHVDLRKTPPQIAMKRRKLGRVACVELGHGVEF